MDMSKGTDESYDLVVLGQNLLKFRKNEYQGSWLLPKSASVPQERTPVAMRRYNADFPSRKKGLLPTDSLQLLELPGRSHLPRAPLPTPCPFWVTGVGEHSGGGEVRGLYHSCSTQSSWKAPFQLQSPWGVAEAVGPALSCLAPNPLPHRYW